MIKALSVRKVWVHCAKNMRVSVFVYLYRRHVLGEDDPRASFPMREVWSPNEVWQAFIAQVGVVYSNNSLPALRP